MSDDVCRCRLCMALPHAIIEAERNEQQRRREAREAAKRRKA